MTFPPTLEKSASSREYPGSSVTLSRRGAKSSRPPKNCPKNKLEYYGPRTSENHLKELKQNCKNKKKDTPLIAILTFNSQYRASIIRLLLKQGALTNVTNLENKSPVELAWNSKNFAEITKILIFEGGAIPPAKLMLEQDNQDEDFFKTT